MKRRGIIAILSVLTLAFAYVVYLRFAGESQLALAKLVETQGEPVERDFAGSEGAWANAEPGARFDAGDGLRTGKGATANLVLIDHSELIAQPETVLRFTLGDAPGTLGVDVQSGEALLRTGASDLMLLSHAGSFLVKAGSAVMLRREGDLLGIALQMGRIEFRDAAGALQVLGPGSNVRLSIGMALVADDDANASRSVKLTVHAGGARIRKRGEADFSKVAPGTLTVTPGTELSLAEHESARVSRGAERADLRGEGEFILDSEGALVVARRGELSVDGAEQDVRIRVPGGLIIARKAVDGTRAHLAIGKDEGRLSVESGAVSATLDGNTEELSAGDTRTWSIGSVSPASQVVDGRATLVAPDYFNLGVSAGESFVLHAPELPVSIAFDFGSRCPGEGELQVAGFRAGTRGKQQVNVLFAKGTRAYTLRCVNANGSLGRIVARGTVHALLDPGTRKLPPLPPTSLADADGRTYTLYYSNQPPALNIRWPNPPSATRYTLTLDGKTLEVASPEHTFKSGSLSDGTHQISFRAGARQSRTTSVVVRFDNNAPTASVSEPKDRSFSPGQDVKIDGVSLEGWKVSLEGGTITKGPDGRFSGSIVTSSNKPDFAVRLTHPRRGVHYYLRRAASSP